MIDAVLRESVRRRASDRCEYCRLPQHAIEETFHIEHIISLQHVVHDADADGNLALACHNCNHHKGPNLSSVDPDTDAVVQLFHPRVDDWHDHFALHRAEIIGKTPKGRATARLLKFNTSRRVALRATLISEGEFKT